MQIHSDHFCQLGWIRCAFSGIAVAAKFGFRISCERPMISFIASFHATTAGKQATLCRSIPTVGAVRSVSVQHRVSYLFLLRQTMCKHVFSLFKPTLTRIQKTSTAPRKLSQLHATRSTATEQEMDLGFKLFCQLLLSRSRTTCQAKHPFIGYESKCK